MLPDGFRPMLAAKAEMDQVRYPAIASPKVDGIRCVSFGGVPYSRKLKPIPNLFVQKVFAAHAELLEGLDGELIVGNSNDPDLFRNSTSALMSEHGEPDFRFCVFDVVGDGPYEARLRNHTVRIECLNLPWLRTFDSTVVYSAEDLMVEMRRNLEQGYEGTMLRCPDAPYKRNRSTAREGYLLKVKEFEDSEAEIIGFEEQMHNGNAATVDELGLTKRSTHKANKTGKGTLGKLRVRGIGAFEGIEFAIGSGFDHAEAQSIWDNQESWLGKIVKYRYFAGGVKDKPRFPVYLGVRHPDDFDRGD